ncbi:MAG: RagB/SusD family nutrient uptake outer membrane protein [Muribaculaceae bacterium]|nr:RagB/SusD family nutrient uptake outer membrane protein [Muribaculaceae bacterium]
MNKYITGLFIGASLVSLTACNDFLNEQPVDKIIPETFFTDADNLKAYTLNFYTVFPNHGMAAYRLGTFTGDDNTDNTAAFSASTRWAPGEWRTGTGTDNWGFGNIRSLNYFIQHTLEELDKNNIGGSTATINQAIGEAYFFRAYEYYRYYVAVGDYPIIDDVLPENDRDLLVEKSKRYPRNQVARHILDDLTKAISYLPETSAYGNNGLNKDCAHLLRSRVALLEGTWLKYHKGTALVPGGPNWPGDASMLGSFNIDSEIDFFLGEAMTDAKAVGDKFVNNLTNNTDTPEGMGPGLTELNPYYCMFCSVDMSGYDEVLLYKQYSFSQGQVSQIQNQFQGNGGGSGYTRGLINSFLMRNGLPIYAAGSGYDPAWENQGVSATIQDRDSRIKIFMKGDGSIISYGTDGNTPSIYRGGWLLDGIESTSSITGYPVKKGQGYDFNQGSANLRSETGAIVFRAVEALLNYMEASVERTGNVDGTADAYWRAIRNRAKVNPDYNITIAATNMAEEAKGDWGAYSNNSYVSPLIYNVRRERRNELMAEGFRMDDLRRWAALNQMIETPYQIEGMKYWGTVYSDLESDMCLTAYTGEKIIGTVAADGTGNMSSPDLSDYVRPYQISLEGNYVWDGYRFNMAHYLSPIGHDAFVNAEAVDGDISSTVIYQNPGWPIDGGKGCISGFNFK